MSPFKRYRDAAIIVLLLAVPFRFIGASMKKPENLNIVDRAILRVSAPIEFAASSLARGLSNLWGDYVYLVDVKADNGRLAYDNARLRERVHGLEQNEVENRQLKRLLQLREILPGDAISAQVVTLDHNEFFRATRVVLDRGSRDVRANLPVVSPDGVVGSVLHVTGDAVDVQLVADAAFSLDVEDERTHARGLVRGTGDPARYACKVETVTAEDEVDVGDLLVTSGKGRWFPKGLSVARVTKVTKRELGRDQEVEAAPTVNFSRLEDVLILVSSPDIEEEAPRAPSGGPPATASRGSGGHKP
jgi:rod shape-determining protein MreC